MKMKGSKKDESNPLAALEFGTLVSYRGKRYFYTAGLEAPIVTDTRGHWTFARELEWKSFKVLY